MKRRSLFEQSAARRNRHGGQLDVGALADHLALELGEGTPDICIIMRPAGLAVSIASVSERKLLPAASTRSRIVSKSSSEQDRRSRSFRTTSVPAARS